MNKERFDKGLWWDRAWSLIKGCSPVSEACDHCWLATETHMRASNPNAKIQADNVGLCEGRRFNGTIRTLDKNLDLPVKTKKPTVWAIWSDLFHEAVPDKFIEQALNVVYEAKKHIFIILTKRPERMVDFLMGESGAGANFEFENVWWGTTVENQRTADERIPHLLEVLGKRFLSMEPLLGPVDLSRCWRWGKTCNPSDDDFCNGCTHSVPIKNIHAVIVGSESGPGARPAKIEWIESIVEQCKNAGVPCFVKQVHINGKLSKNPAEWPESIRVRQLPWMEAN